MKFLFFLTVATLIAVTVFRLLLPPVQEEEDEPGLPAEEEQFERLLQELLGPAGTSQQQAHDRFLAMGPLVLARLTQVLSQELFLAQNPHYIERLKALIEDFGLRAVPVLLDLLEEDGDDPSIVHACQELLLSFGTTALPVLLNRSEEVHFSALMPVFLTHQEASLNALMQRLERFPNEARYMNLLRRFGREAEESLLLGVRTWTGMARQRAFLLLAEMASENAVSLFCEALSEPFPQVRVASVMALGRLECRSALSLLLPLLQDPEAEVRQEVLRSLARFKDERALPALLQFQAKQDAGTPRAEQVLLILALHHSGNSADVQTFVSFLQEKGGLHESWTMDVVRCLPPEEQLPFVRSLLIDEENPCRRDALSLVETWDAVRSARFLMGLLGRLEPLDAFVEAVEQALPRLGEESLSVFHSALETDEERYSRVALRTLLQMPHADSVQPVLRYFDRNDVNELYWELDLELVRQFLLQVAHSPEECKHLEWFVARHSESMLGSELQELLSELNPESPPKSALTRDAESIT